MSKFILTAALAATGALGFAGKADAQVSYGFQTYVPGANVVVGERIYATPFGARAVERIYSPFTGFQARGSVSANVFGNYSTRLNGYNPYYNLGYRSGYNYTPYGFYGPRYNRYGYFYRR